MVNPKDDLFERPPSADIGVHTGPEVATAVEGGPLPSLRDMECRYIARVLREARGNQRRAARILGISRWSLARRVRKYGLQPRTAAQ